MPIYMKFEGIDGEVTTKGFEKCIELDSAQFGHKREVASMGTNDARKGTPEVTEIVITKKVDGASSDLFREGLAGKGRKVTIYFVTTGQDQSIPYLTLEMQDTLVSSYQVQSGLHSAGGKPAESLSLNFTKITYTVTPLDPKLKGSPKSTTYDLQTGAVH